MPQPAMWIFDRTLTSERTHPNPTFTQPQVMATRTASPSPAAAAAKAYTASRSNNTTAPPRAVLANPALLALPRHIPPAGQVGLGHKGVPINQLPEEAWGHVPLCRTRGQVCVAGLKRKLAEGGPKLWQEEEARKSNVGVIRPSHDAWGIGKIVFVYCDDFLRRCFEMPWMHDPEWRALLLPIFDALGVPPHKIVRCLLASMPPGIAIPPHHDTGYWVHYTHRIHLPVITDPAHIAFRVGPSDAHLQRFDLAEGHLIELNNQAKHSVDNCWGQHRVHLIMDYIEGNSVSIERTLLSPGTKINQTRRSIDLESERGIRPCPSYIIIGAQKCGTTSLYEYLCQHPLVLRARRRETHYLDWRWRREEGLTWREHRDTYHKFFHKAILDENPSCLTGESTPSYMLHSDVVVPRVRELAPEAKMLVMLRCPVARAYSQYQMVIDPDGTPEQKKARGTLWKGKSFEEVVEKELEELEACGVTPDMTYEEFKTRFLASRPLGHGSHSLLGRGLYALQLQPWMAEFGGDKGQLMVLFTEEMRTGEAAQTQVGKVFAFLGLPPHDIIDTDAKNTRQYEQLDEKMQARLAAFYAPFNDKLFEMLARPRGMAGWAGMKEEGGVRNGQVLSVDEAKSEQLRTNVRTEQNMRRKRE